ncbi:hypothetical protein BO71DRAFT_13113 [Aspergillus ellipticus CBS 707.79]|uniref:Secreted protein n=1 Tax=Aspergillus ellipticus CBS 707.79 TaxID=1448320 RepID=A0A319EDG3_9EURO|nr:hypothetical protein BO71DRAFT_13113 [Aspergillus ellipticus CBS 707.79]
MMMMMMMITIMACSVLEQRTLAETCPIRQVIPVGRENSSHRYTRQWMVVDHPVPCLMFDSSMRPPRQVDTRCDWSGRPSHVRHALPGGSGRM